VRGVMLHLGPGASRKRVPPSPDLPSGNNSAALPQRQNALTNNRYNDFHLLLHVSPFMSRGDSKVPTSTAKPHNFHEFLLFVRDLISEDFQIAASNAIFPDAADFPSVRDFSGDGDLCEKCFAGWPETGSETPV
jgi:hypothetical protein